MTKVDKNLAKLIDILHLDVNGHAPTEIPNMNRDGLAGIFAKLGYKVGAEIGVERGLYSEVLCKVIPGLHLYAVDWWHAYKGYRDHVSQEQLEEIYQDARKRLSPYDVEILRMSSEFAKDEIEDDSLDFVYIDGNHELPWIMSDIIWWSRKVHKGGIVAGHDYYVSDRFDSKCHVVPAVKCYADAYRIRPWFVLGRKEKRPGEIRETSRSWFWVKTWTMH